MNCSLLLRPLALLCALYISQSYRAALRSGEGYMRLRMASSSREIVPTNKGNADNSSNSNNNINDNVARKEALDILDCLTSTIDVEDAEFNENKYERRQNILNSVDYSDLKVELKTRGLKTGGDKLEMIIRLLLHIVDPQIKFSETSGTEAQLKYIDNKDILEDKTVRLNPISMRRDSGTDFLVGNVDADDMKVLSAPDDSSDIVIKGSAKVMTDGMMRQEVEIPLVTQLASEQMARQGKMSMIATTVDSIDMYIVSSRGVLRGPDELLPVVILLSDGPTGGAHRETARSIADEIAFTNQCVVAMPDIFSIDAAISISHGKGDGNRNCEQEQLSAAIVSAMLHCRSEYGGGALALAGVGLGAGQALQMVSYISRAKIGAAKSEVSVPESRKERDFLRRIVSDNSFRNVDGVLAVEPMEYDGAEIGASLDTRALLIFSEDADGGAAHADSPNNRLYNALRSRSSKKQLGFVCNFRVYQKLGNKRYMYSPAGDREVKYRSDSLAVGSTWLDCITRSADHTGGEGGVAVDIFSF